MPTGVTAKNAPVTVEDAISAKQAVLSGVVPKTYINMWMQQRLTLLGELIERYAGEKVRISVGTDKEEIAWTVTDPDGKHHIFLAANNLMRYVLQWDENTERIGQDITTFSTMMTAVTYHEMGHVIYTPEFIDEAPEAMVTLERQSSEFTEFLNGLSEDDRAEALLCLAIIPEQRGLYGLDDQRKRACKQLFHDASVRLGEIASPWAEAELSTTQSISDAKINRVFNLSTTTAGRIKADNRLFPPDVNTQVGNKAIFEVIDTALARIFHGNVEFMTPAGIKAISKAAAKWKANYTDKDIKKIIEEAERELSNIIGSAKNRGVNSLLRQISFKSWKTVENILEDQRLETQLAQQFGGLGPRFQFMVSKQMDSRDRYALTAGRMYLPMKFLEEDRQMTELSSKNDPGVPSQGGMIPWYRRLGVEYVVLNASTEVERMTQVQGVYIILSMFTGGTWFKSLPEAGIDKLELAEGDTLNSQTKKRSNEQKKTEKEMADKTKEQTDKALAAEQAVETDPVKKARLEAAALLSSYRKVLVNIAADQRLVDAKEGKKAHIQAAADAAKARREARAQRSAGSGPGGAKSFADGDS